MSAERRGGHRHQRTIPRDGGTSRSSEADALKDVGYAKARRKNRNKQPNRQ